MNNKMFIGQKIRDLRKSMKLTQNQFAELIDLSENALGKLERGINSPNIDTLYKISEKSKIPIETLVSPKKRNPSRELAKPLLDFYTYLKTCSPEEIKLNHRIATKIFGKEKLKKKGGKSIQKAILVITGDLLKIFLIK
jgi:transcriptional regulator with XRE-family HTH domain